MAAPDSTVSKRGRADSPPSRAAKEEKDDKSQAKAVEKSGLSPVAIAALVICAVASGGSFFIGKDGLKKAMESTIDYVEKQGDNGMYVYLLFTFIAIITPIPSTTPLEFAGGFLFSPQYGMINTWLLTCLAKFGANFVSVLIARYVVRDWVVKNFVEKSELMTMVARAIKDEPYKMSLLVRGSMAPLMVKNYGLGVMDVGFLPIALTSCIFTPFYAFQNIYVGSQCQNIKEVFSPKKADPNAGTDYVGLIKTLVPVVMNIALIWLLVRAVKKQVKKTREETERSMREKDAKKDK